MVDPVEGLQHPNLSDSELRVRLDNLNKIAENKQQVAAAESYANNASRPTAIPSRDAVTITREASVIAGSGLDKSQSAIRRSGDMLEFNLRFDSDRFSEMTTKGSFSPAKREMNLFVSFNFADDIKLPEGGQERRSYNARIKLEAVNVTSETFGQLQGQDGKIEGIVDNMLSRMLERAYSRQYPPTSIVLKLHDIADLVSEKGGVFQKVSRAMMVLNNSLARALEGHSGKDAAALEDLVSNAVNSDGSVELKDFSFQLKDITPTLGGKPLGEGASTAEGAAKPKPNIVGGGAGSAAPEPPASRPAAPSGEGA